MGIALTAHTFFDVYPLISISMVLSAISMLGLIISDQVEQSLRQQRETAEQQRELARQKEQLEEDLAMLYERWEELSENA